MWLFFAVAFLIGGLLGSYVMRQRGGALAGISRETLIASLTGCVMCILMASHVEIPYGHGGVATEFGEVKPTAFGPGIDFKVPWWRIHLLDTRVKVHTNVYPCSSADQQSVDIKMVVNYQPTLEQLPTLFKEIGATPEIVQARVLDPAANESLKAKVSKYKLSDLLEERRDIKTSVLEDVRVWLAKYQLQCDEIALADVNFSDKYDAVIETKQVEEQRALSATYELKRAETMAQLKEEEADGRGLAAAELARGRAESVKLIAEAQAKATRTIAQAEAAAYAEIQASFSPLLLQREFVNVWNGKLTPYTVGSGSFPIDLEALTAPPKTN